MDAKNTFETPITARLARLEWLGFLLVVTVLVIMNWSAVDWWLFVGLFVIIDVIGYLPGAIAHRRSRDGAIGKIFYVLYNSMHCLFTWTVILSAATLLVGWQWAMLAVPLHLLGDRALFGNSLKPFGVPFEPQTVSSFAEFRRDYATGPVPWRPGPSGAASPDAQPLPESSRA